MNKFDDIQAFVAVVDEGSFTAAARRLQAAKSALSRRVSALERRLGMQLLTRTTRALDLTGPGRNYYEHATRILSDLAETEAAIQQENAELSGTLHVMLPLSFAVRHLCGPISSFCKMHPKIRFDLELYDRPVDLVGEVRDLAVRIGGEPNPAMVAQRLFDVRYVACASPHYLNVHGTPETPKDLSDHICLMHSQCVDADNWAYEDRDGSRQRVKVNTGMRASSDDFLCNAAAHGQGIAILPTYIAADPIRRGNLIPVLANYGWQTSQAYVVCAPTRQLSIRVRAFSDYLLEKFAETQQWDLDCGTSRKARTDV